MPKTKRQPVSIEGQRALMTYAEEHGRTWKQSLSIDWYSGRTVGVLQWLRNSASFGPRGLIEYRLPRLVSKVMPGGLGFDIVNERDDQVFGTLLIVDAGPLPKAVVTAFVDDRSSMVLEITSDMNPVHAYQLAMRDGKLTAKVD